jgi:hypothetical protein
MADVDNKEKKTFKYEYNHFDLGYGMHYGMHSFFGEHIAFGTGSNMVHIYPYKIYIGDDNENALEVSPEQQRVLRNIFKIIGRRIEAAKLDPEVHKGEIQSDDTPR